ncbi:hypothetical protein CKF54_07085 [Psittacicella hinzii]|uniref:STAS domain-containing protein n=1 Tax=Psittacicella hinzii TaxID=2028575 RepID=A0A3A1Y1Z8_9GAMM|nr:STAS domain-containing protein [Psittacicella hinzii]RIY31248.1 hypothetical protein CKF54_07085 [Psittacicella hinzii]
MYTIDLQEGVVTFNNDLTHSTVATLEKNVDQIINELKSVKTATVSFDFSKCESVDTSGFALILVLLRKVEDDKALKTKEVHLQAAERIKVFASLYDLTEFLNKYF